jgi:hypothetical protein
MLDLILTVICKIGLFILEQLNASKETFNSFMEFVELAANDTKSTRLMNFWRESKNWFDSHPFEESAVIKGNKKQTDNKVVHPIGDSK